MHGARLLEAPSRDYIQREPPSSSDDTIMPSRKELLLAGRTAAIAASDASEWRHGRAPDYSRSNEQLPAQRTQRHAPDSLEAIVEHIVQIFEMEVSHKPDPSTWLSVARERFRMSLNGGEACDAQTLAERGSYNVLIGDSPFYEASRESFDTSHELFHGAFPGGFFWEVLEVISPPPLVTVKWRHWGDFTGSYKGFAATGQRVELVGVSLVKLNDELQVVEIEHFYDNSQFLGQLTGGCPIAHGPR